MAATEVGRLDAHAIQQLEGAIETVVADIERLDAARADLIRARDDLIRARGLQDTSLRRLGGLAKMSYQNVWFILRAQ